MIAAPSSTALATGGERAIVTAFCSMDIAHILEVGTLTICSGTLDAPEWLATGGSRWGEALKSGFQPSVNRES